MSRDFEEGVAKAGVAGATKHVFVCIGPDCCRLREGEATWEYMKKRLKVCGVKAMRTKAGCFRICTEGPLMVIYPDGVWYSQVTPARFERVLQEHIIGGRPVREWVVARNVLGCGAPGRTSDL